MKPEEGNGLLSTFPLPPTYRSKSNFSSDFTLKNLVSARARAGVTLFGADSVTLRETMRICHAISTQTFSRVLKEMVTISSSKGSPHAFSLNIYCE